VRGHFERRTFTDKSGKLRKMSTWSVWYEQPHQPGEPRKQKLKGGFRTRKEASEWFTKKAEELRQGIAPVDDRQTVEQYLKQWLLSVTDSISGSALHAYRNHVEAHIIPALGKVRLTELKPEHLERAKVKWASSILKRREEGTILTLSTRTVRHIYETLNVALNRAKRQRRIIVNPCELLDPPRVVRIARNPLVQVSDRADESIVGWVYRLTRPLHVYQGDWSSGRGPLREPWDILVDGGQDGLISGNNYGGSVLWKVCGRVFIDESDEDGPSRIVRINGLRCAGSVGPVITIGNRPGVLQTPKVVYPAEVICQPENNYQRCNDPGKPRCPPRHQAIHLAGALSP
jgi:Phage integrase, N-terminal SAM-like domain/Arm DNA-binding domain